MHQYIRESEVGNKEAVASALSQYLKGENFEGKREFIVDHSGLAFLKEALVNTQRDQVRLHKKILMLVYDIIVYDD